MTIIYHDDASWTFNLIVHDDGHYPALLLCIERLLGEFAIISLAKNNLLCLIIRRHVFVHAVLKDLWCFYLSHYASTVWNVSEICNRERNTPICLRVNTIEMLFETCWAVNDEIALAAENDQTEKN
jgi:hypothetical protein